MAPFSAGNRRESNMRGSRDRMDLPVGMIEGEAGTVLAGSRSARNPQRASFGWFADHRRPVPMRPRSTLPSPEWEVHLTIRRNASVNFYYRYVYGPPGSIGKADPRVGDYRPSVWPERRAFLSPNGRKHLDRPAASAVLAFLGPDTCMITPKRLG
jgi:hypothetical protein